MELKQEDERGSDHVFTSVSGEHISLPKFKISNYRKILTKSILLMLPSRLERWVSCLKYLNFSPISEKWVRQMGVQVLPDCSLSTESAMWVPVPSLLQAVYGEYCDWWCIWTISRLHIHNVLCNSRSVTLHFGYLLMIVLFKNKILTLLYILLDSNNARLWNATNNPTCETVEENRVPTVYRNNGQTFPLLSKNIKIKIQ